MRLLDMVAYTAAALLGGEQALVCRGRGAAWRVVGCFRGDGPGLTGRSLAGASMLAFDTLVTLRLDAFRADRPWMRRHMMDRAFDA